MDAREWVIGVDQTSSGDFHNIIRLHTFVYARRTLEFNVGIINNMQKQKASGDTNRVAGIVVVREQEDGTFNVLSLLPGAEAIGKSGKPFYRFYGTYDIPKGHSKAGESSMSAALREAEEEARYNADNLDFRWGNKSILVNGKRGKKGVFFVAHSDVDPVITRNPENGMLEHGGFKWVSFDEMESKTSNFWFGDAIRWARKIVEPSNNDELNETLLRNLIRQVLTEATPRRNKNKRVLYHINKYRPARPQVKKSYMQEWDSSAIDPDTGEKTGNMVNVPGTNTWERYWLKDPIKSGVFLTPNPTDIAMFHGRVGNVYAYMVPEWVIAKAGGIHRYDWGSEILISEDIWNEAGVKGGPPYEKTGEIEFLGKSMDAQELRDSMKSSDYGRGYTRKATTPSWLSDEELAAWEKQRKAFKLSGLRKTKHPKDVIKMLKPAEVKAALVAFEKEYEEKPDTFIHHPNDRKGFKVSGKTLQPTPQDQELIDMLLKRDKELSESIIHRCIKELLWEALLVEKTALPLEYFTVIDNAVEKSNFWEEPNTQNDIDIYETSSGAVLGTPAAEALSVALHQAIDELGLDMDILVRSHDTDNIKGMTLHPNHPAWPNRWLVDAKWYISKERLGRNTIDIELMTAESSDNINDALDSSALVRHITQTIRHELIHRDQMMKQAKNKGVSEIEAFDQMLNDPKQVPPDDLNFPEWRRKYLESHIEIDAHAHDGAEELAAAYSNEEAKNILRGLIDLNDKRLPNAIKHYYETLGADHRATKKFMSKLYSQYMSMIS